MMEVTSRVVKQEPPSPAVTIPTPRWGLGDQLSPTGTNPTLTEGHWMHLEDGTSYYQLQQAMGSMGVLPSSPRQPPTAVAHNVSSIMPVAGVANENNDTTHYGSQQARRLSATQTNTASTTPVSMITSTPSNTSYHRQQAIPFVGVVSVSPQQPSPARTSPTSVTPAPSVGTKNGDPGNSLKQMLITQNSTTAGKTPGSMRLPIQICPPEPKHMNGQKREGLENDVEMEVVYDSGKNTEAEENISNHVTGELHHTDVALQLSQSEFGHVKGCKIRPKERQLMLPWLTDKVNSGKILGLEWYDFERRMIRIPWKHGSRQNWQEIRDACLFKEWAIHTGRYNPKSPDPKRWKANFRCALNSLPDVEELKHLSMKKGMVAFKIYRILDKKQQKQKLKKETQQAVRIVQNMGAECQAESNSPPLSLTANGSLGKSLPLHQLTNGPSVNNITTTYGIFLNSPSSNGPATDKAAFNVSPETPRPIVGADADKVSVCPETPRPILGDKVSVSPETSRPIVGADADKDKTVWMASLNLQFKSQKSLLLTDRVVTQCTVDGFVSMKNGGNSGSDVVLNNGCDSELYKEESVAACTKYKEQYVCEDPSTKEQYKCEDKGSPAPDKALGLYCNAVVQKNGVNGGLLSNKHDAKHVCHHCGKRFFNPSVLTRHARQHLTTKHGRQHQCGICRKAFKRIQQLYMHMLDHQTGRDGECPVCRKQFNQEEALKRHARCHTEGRLYECRICGLYYAREIHLKIHIYREHAQENTDSSGSV